LNPPPDAAAAAGSGVRRVWPLPLLLLLLPLLQPERALLLLPGHELPQIQLAFRLGHELKGGLGGRVALGPEALHLRSQARGPRPHFTRVAEMHERALAAVLAVQVVRSPVLFGGPLARVLLKV